MIKTQEQTFKAGIYKFKRTDDYNYDVSYYCSCGNNEKDIVENMRQAEEHVCSKCENKYYQFLRDYEDRTQMSSFIINDLSTTMIKFTRNNFSATVSNEKFKILSINMKRSLEIDIRKEKIVVYKNDELEYYRIGKSASFFNKGVEEQLDGKLEKQVVRRFILFFNRNMRTRNSLSLVENVINKSSNVSDYDVNLVNGAKKFFGLFGDVSSIYMRKSRSYSRVSKDILYIYDIVEIINDSQMEVFMFCEKLINAGFKLNSSYIIQLRYNSSLGKYIYSFDFGTDFDYKKRKLHQAFDVPKQILKMVRDYDIGVGSAKFESLIKLFSGKTQTEKNLSMNIIAEANKLNIVDRLLDSSTINRVQFLINQYNYDIYHLLNYLFFEVPMYQGIESVRTALTTLSDYLSMSVDLGFRYDKYPESLKKSHDVKMVMYKNMKQKIDDEKFKLAVRDYTDFIYRDSVYQVVVPRNQEDVINEGGELGHCIASYVSRIINKSSLILFMREKEDLSKRLISLELSPSGRLIQARGKYNRKPTNDEKIFINDWVKHVENTIRNRPMERIVTEAF